MRKIERFIRLDIHFLQRKGLLEPGKTFPLKWKTGDSIRCEVGDDFVLLRYGRKRPDGECENIKLWVPLTWTPCNYGGRRPWFVCPECDRRAGILYLAGKYFQCRVCHKLQYRCQCESPWDRALRKRRKLEKRLGPEEWRKPKGMHQTTFDRLRSRLIDAEKMADELFCILTARYFRRHSGAF